MGENTRFEKLKTLKEIAETLNEGHYLQETLDAVLKKLLDLTGLRTAWLFLIDEKGGFELAASAFLPEALAYDNSRLLCEGGCYCIQQYRDENMDRATNIIHCQRIEAAIKMKRGDPEGITHHATVPLRDQNKRFGLLNVAAPGKSHFDREELALLEAVALQIGTAIKRIKLAEHERRNLLLTERNRLAQDLHDSVNQMIFSLSLTAKAAGELTDNPDVCEMLEFIQHLSHEALLEMRALIWQLRPQGLEEGLSAAVEKYAEVLGLDVNMTQSGVLRLSPEEEELFWRLSQEALSNCKKHAEAKLVHVNISVSPSSAVLEIEDDGKGFLYDPDSNLPTFGLKGMKERTEKAGGLFQLETDINKGTKIRVLLPLREKGEAKWRK
ncbi:MULTISPECIES: GAF domain-containing sensor histidine kinase [Bacillus]|uniref:GAF domain-containing sensor histidine kinase n=1 Tax=Bacillus TaxID=1386 RepID=UPI00047E1A8A|nr:MULTISPECIES: GAF domain-containing sensor histidine kinase [Bacillus]QHZ49036.1 GAF domain-containing sensor histidine kinase [Bacillus sp. NSP9.1]WFA07356.1 GAF domain-containing sensor histidine kinase [Bacillus sp. HSf4]